MAVQFNLERKMFNLSGRSVKTVRHRERVAAAATPTSSASLKIVDQDPRSLKPHPRNKVRKHSDKQLQKLAAGIKRLGFNVPILVNAEGFILAGHARAAAAVIANLSSVPTICLDHLSAEEQRVFLIADNKLGNESTWDRELLKIELAELVALDLDLQFDLAPFTAFDTGEIDVLLDDTPQDVSTDPADQIPDVPSNRNVVSCRGDLWVMGHHRLLCGDALDESQFKVLFPDQKRAQMIFCDPPYNVKISNVSGMGKIQHDEFLMASGEMSSGEFAAFLTKAFANMAAYSQDGSIHFLCSDNKHLREMLTAGEAVYSELKNLITWVKPNAGMGSFYRSRSELIWAFKYGRAPHINTFMLGEQGRWRSNVWEYAGMNSFGPNRDALLQSHPTPKPVALVADAIRDCSLRGGIILDAFVGSGTLFVAADRTGRIGYGLEILEKYCDVAVRRWEAQTGKQARLEATNQTFAEVARARGGDAHEEGAQ